MSRIKVHKEKGEPGALISAFGTQLFLNGREVNHVRSIDLHISLDDAVRAKIDVFATEELDLEFDAQVTINVTPLDESFVIEETPTANGGRLFSLKRVLA